MRKKYTLLLLISLATAKYGFCASVNNYWVELNNKDIYIPDSILKKMLKRSDLVCKARLVRMGLYVVWDWGKAEANNSFKVNNCLKGKGADTISAYHLCYHSRDKACMLFLKYNKEYLLFLKNKQQYKTQINSPGSVSFYVYEHYKLANNDFGMLYNTKILEQRVMELIKEEHLQQ